MPVLSTMESAVDQSDSAAVELFTPGRICLFGEHSDWAGTYRKFNNSIVPGRALCCGTQQGLFARARKHRSLVVTSTANDGSVSRFECEMDPPTLLAKAQEGGFWAYAAGVAYEIAVHFAVEGLHVDNYLTTLPIKKGLSSSAAWCVLLSRAFNQVYHLRMTTRGEMDIAYRGERCTPSQCGRLDQCCAFGSQLVSMTFNGDQLDTDAVQLHVPIHLLVIDLCRAKDTKKILADLNKAYPVAKTPTEEGVHMLLGPINDKIVNDALFILTNDSHYAPKHNTPHSSAAPASKPSASNKSLHTEPQNVAQRLGALMKQSQHNFNALARPQCPSELTAPHLQRLLAYEPIQALIWGGKGIGSQGDGSAQLVCKGAAEQQQVAAILQKDLGVDCMPLTIGVSQADSKIIHEHDVVSI